jgi:c-di-GMP-binding flagellar brake protein YcgR
VYFSPSGHPLKAGILDLSLGGGLIQLETPYPTFLGAVIEIAFTVNQLPFRVRAKVRAVRSEASLGLAFEVTSERTRRNLQDLIEELEEDHAKRQANKLLTRKRRAALGA